MIGPVPNQHADRKSLAVRPPEADLTAARAVFKTEGWDARAFITACLRALVSERGRMLALITPYRPPPKPLGRPRKAAPDPAPTPEPQRHRRRKS